MRKTSVIVLAVGMALAALVASPRGVLAQQDETAESAVWLLKKGTLVHSNGLHNILLRALRQLNDPDLEPLFSGLVEKRHPVLKIHGILALGEISKDKVLDLKLVADLKDAGTQAQLVSSAIEGDLLNDKQCKEMMTWPGLETPVKIIIAAKLVAEKKLDTPEEKKLLTDAMSAENGAVRAMAALMKLQLGDASAMASLEKLNSDDQREVDNIRIMVLQSAMRYDFDSLAPLAMKWATEPNVDPAVSFLALRAAIKFGAPRAAEAWTQRYDSTDSLAERVRLAVLVLDLAEKLDPSTFDVLIKDDKLPTVQHVGEVGKLIASGKDATQPTIRLLEENNLLLTKWVFTYGKGLSIDKGEPILVALIRNAEGGSNPDRFRGERLENVVLAAEQIAEQAPDAKKIIGDLINEVPQLSQEAILMGLIRSEAKDPQTFIDGVTEWKGDTADALALLLRAKHGVAFDQAQIDKLALIVRGGAGLQEPLRVQAAWIYLKKTKQERFALANVLGQ
ncbi:MAG: hypothetical protein GC159_08615 [Phycisphaera sp.]|nr:hypothetical protein [Phycisphaera sp.]